MTRSALQTSLLWVLVATACGAPARSTPPFVAGPPEVSTTHTVATQPTQGAATDAPPEWLDDALSAPEAATTATAIQADKATPSSKALIFCHSAATARAFVALLLALAPPAQSSESPSSAATTGSTRIG